MKTTTLNKIDTNHLRQDDESSLSGFQTPLSSTSRTASKRGSSVPRPIAPNQNTTSSTSSSSSSFSSTQTTPSLFSQRSSSSTETQKPLYSRYPETGWENLTSNSRAANASTKKVRKKPESPSLIITAIPKSPTIGGRVSDQPTHAHESAFLWEGKIYKFTLYIPVSDIDTLTDKTELDKAIKNYKDKFIDHLKRENGAAAFKGKGFDIEFHTNGYTLEGAQEIPKDPTTPVAPVQKADITTDGAKQFSTLIISGEKLTAKEIQDLLSENKNYPVAQQPAAAPVTPAATTVPTSTPTATQAVSPTPPQLTGSPNSCYLVAAVHALASNPAILADLLKDGAITKDHPLKAVLEKYKAGEPIDLTELQAKLGFTSGKQDDAQSALLSLMDAIDPVIAKSIFSSVTSEWSYKKEGAEIWRKVTGAGSSIQAPIISILPGQSIAKLFKDELAWEVPPNSEERNIDQKLKAQPYREKVSFDKDPNILFVHVQRTAGIGKKSSDSIVAPAKVMLKNTNYELTSFTRHFGSSTDKGHYQTYMKQGNAYWLADNFTMQSIKEDDFKTAAVHAYDLIYTKTGSVVPNATAPAPIKLGEKGSFSTALSDANRNEYFIISEKGSKPIPYDESALKALLTTTLLKDLSLEIYLVSNHENIKKMNAFAAEIVRLKTASIPKKEVVDLTVIAIGDKAPKGTGVKSDPGPNGIASIDTQYAEILKYSTESTDKFVFNLRAEQLNRDTFSKNGEIRPFFAYGDADKSDEQETLDKLLPLIEKTNLNGKKVTFVVSKDILIKNFERISAALEAADKLNPPKPPVTPTTSEPRKGVLGAIGNILWNMLPSRQTQSN